MDHVKELATIPRRAAGAVLQVQAQLWTVLLLNRHCKLAAAVLASRRGEGIQRASRELRRVGLIRRGAGRRPRHRRRIGRVCWRAHVGVSVGAPQLGAEGGGSDLSYP